MDAMLRKLHFAELIDSKDHRVVQSIAMFAFYNGEVPEFSHPECVSKSWPQFWKFMDFVKKNYH
jgi:5-enolpyruvylshikimate-3-phosphate synthase